MGPPPELPAASLRAGRSPSASPTASLEGIRALSARTFALGSTGRATVVAPVMAGAGGGGKDAPAWAMGGSGQRR